MLLSFLAPQVQPVLSRIYAAKRVKLCLFLPAHAIRIRLFMPKPFVVCAEVSGAGSSCNRHPWTSLFGLSSGRDFAREVGFRPNSTYDCATPVKFPFYHSNSQLLSFVFLIFRLALRDWTGSRSAARGSFAHFFAYWSASSFLSIPAWLGIH